MGPSLAAPSAGSACCAHDRSVWPDLVILLARTAKSVSLARGAR